MQEEVISKRVPQGGSQKSKVFYIKAFACLKWDLDLRHVVLDCCNVEFNFRVKGLGVDLYRHRSLKKKCDCSSDLGVSSSEHKWPSKKVELPSSKHEWPSKKVEVSSSEHQ